MTTYIRQNVINNDNEDNSRGSVIFVGTLLSLKKFRCTTTKEELASTFMQLIQSNDNDIRIVSFCISLELYSNGEETHMHFFIRIESKHTLQNMANLILDCVNYNTEYAATVLPNLCTFLYIKFCDGEAAYLAYITKFDMDPQYHNIETNNFR